jgi:hypothetical protein
MGPDTRQRDGNRKRPTVGDSREDYSRIRVRRRPVAEVRKIIPREALPPAGIDFFLWVGRGPTPLPYQAIFLPASGGEELKASVRMILPNFPLNESTVPFT